MLTLFEAEAAADALLAEAAKYAVPGISESALNEKVRLLALARGMSDFWHKRIVRSGPNTLCPYADNPPDRILEDDDIVFFDFGPVLQKWEADVGRTIVLGDDAQKHRIAKDAKECWHLGKAHFEARLDITGADLFAHIVELAAARGWSYGQEHCGHLIGTFPHEKIQGESRRNYIHPDNHEPMRAPDAEGRARDWILEVHFVDREAGIGAFFEQWLTRPPESKSTSD